MAIQSFLNRSSINVFLNIVTLDDMVAETVDALSSIEKETLDEIYRGVINIPHLQEGLKAIVESPEGVLDFF